MTEIDPSGNGAATGPTDDATLNKIAAWCDEHGWDELGSPKFEAWMVAAKIDPSKVWVHKCGGKCEQHGARHLVPLLFRGCPALEHVWDGPMAESEDGCMVVTTTCSKCGEWAIKRFR